MINTSSYDSFDRLCGRVKSAVQVAKNRVLVIFRGLPGRGKTLRANQLQNFCLGHAISTFICAADDFMLDDDGHYCFRFEQLGYCHYRCTKALCNAMQMGVSVVIQHNTNTMSWESAALRANAEELGYLVVYYESAEAWLLQHELPLELQVVMVNSHGVDAEKLATMKQRSELILPYYLGYWFRREELLAHFDRCGYPDALSTVVSKYKRRYDLALYKKNEHLLHITTDYLGTDINSYFTNGYDHSIFRSNSLLPQEFQLNALYFDSRGIGAIVSSSLGSGKLHLFKLFSLDDKDIPHLTLYIADGCRAKDVSDGAKSFLNDYSQQLNDLSLLKESEISSQSYTVLEDADKQSGGLVFHSPLMMHSTYAGAYCSQPNKTSHYQWIHESNKEASLFESLVCRQDVELSEECIPSAILAGLRVGVGSWKIASMRVKPSNWQSVDDIYIANEFLRNNLPVGVCYLVSPQKVTSKILMGIPTSIRLGVLKQESLAGNTLNIAEALAESTATNLHLSCNTQALAQFSICTIDGSQFVVGGCANAFIVSQINRKFDVDLYCGDQYLDMKEIMHCFYDMLEKMDFQSKEKIIDYMSHNRLTAVFDVKKELESQRLIFLTFTSLRRSTGPPLPSPSNDSTVTRSNISEDGGADFMLTLEERAELIPDLWVERI